MDKNKKILFWTIGGLALIAGKYFGVKAYRKYRTSSKDPQKNNRVVIQNLVK